MAILNMLQSTRHELMHRNREMARTTLFLLLRNRRLPMVISLIASGILKVSWLRHWLSQLIANTDSFYRVGEWKGVTFKWCTLPCSNV